MQRVKFVAFCLVIGIAFTISLTSFSHSEDEVKTIQGNVICLIPDYESGNVKPVIATGPCDGLPPHQHVIVTKDAVYQLQGLQDGLAKIQQSPNRSNVEIAGKVQGSEQTGWILFVE